MLGILTRMRSSVPRRVEAVQGRTGLFSAVHTHSNRSRAERAVRCARAAAKRAKNKHRLSAVRRVHTCCCAALGAQRR